MSVIAAFEFVRERRKFYGDNACAADAFIGELIAFLPSILDLLDFFMPEGDEEDEDLKELEEEEDELED